MSVELTAAGQQAFAILQWAYEDPAARVELARQRMATIYGLTQREQNEIGDAASMLSRLASSLQIPGRSISDQMRDGAAG